MIDQQTKGQWQHDEMTTLLDCVEKYSGTTSLLIDEVNKQAGRSPESVKRKLVKMGYLSRTRDGYTTFHRAIGHRK